MGVIETILGFIGGAGFRMLQEWMRIKDAEKQRTHERDMFDLQLRADEARSKHRIQEVQAVGEVQQAVAELGAMIEATKVTAQTFTKTGRWWDIFYVAVEVLNAAVRPTVTYWFVGLFGAYKLASLQLVLSAGASMANAITTVWSPDDYGILSSILGFWFVSRELRRRG